MASKMSKKNGRTSAKPRHAQPPGDEVERRFAQVVDAFAKKPRVSTGKTKGFGSGALKVNGSIFAMLSSKREFVVKLSKDRVDELVEAGCGKRFDSGRGRLMKEWLAVDPGYRDWITLAEEAYAFARTAR
jgi:hypothetical protein